MSESPSQPLRKILELGPTAQPVVAGLYAWAVTVAPVGFGKHGPRNAQNWAATIFATLALVALVRGAVSEALQPDAKANDGEPSARPLQSRNVQASRTFTLFSFAAASVVTWICDTDALSPVRLSAARGVAGMLGWALFAYACSAPVVEHQTIAVRVEAGARARGRVAAGDAIYVGGVTVLVLGLELVGWSVSSPERAMLVRLTTLGAGVLMFGAVGALISARHGSRQEAAPQRARARITHTPLPLGWVVALVLMIAAGLLYVLTE